MAEDEIRLSWLSFGHQILPADCEQSFERLKSKLRHCLREHAACARSIDGSICDEEALPSRVIDLGESSEFAPMLLETKGLRGKYVALSYCWGKPSQSPIVETTKSNLEAFKKKLPVHALPKTIQHAMIATKRLGYRYLWIDRLCIVQDDKIDWEAEAKQMARIYENAVLTLAALGAKHSSEGLFRPRREERSVSLPLKGCELFVSLPTAPIDQQTHQLKLSAMEVKESAWTTRAWVFQEHLFSRRMILYGNEQIIWECRVRLDTECGFGYDAGYTSSKYMYGRDIKDHVNAQICKSVSESPGSSLVPTLSSSLWTEEPLAWAGFIADYSALELTFEGDRLLAMEALSQEVQKLTNQEVCAGMWLGSFPCTLFWWSFWWDESEIEQNGWKWPPVAGVQSTRPTRSSMAGAPSWSWLSSGSPVSFYPFFRDTTLSIDNPRFVHLPNLAPKLMIQAHMITLFRNSQMPSQIIKSKSEKWHRIPPTNFAGIWDRWEADGIYGLLKDKSCKENDGLVLFDNPEVAPEDLECVILGAGQGLDEDSDRDTVYVMILQSVEGSLEYKRIGIGFIVLEPGSDYLKSLAPKQRVILA